MDMRLFEQILGALSGSEEWNRITYDDPVIKMESKRLDAILEQLNSMISNELYSDLDEAINLSQSAYVDAAMLFGMRVAQMFQYVSFNPAEFSNYSARMIELRTAPRQNSV